MRCEPEKFLSRILQCEGRPEWDSQCAMGERLASFERAGGGADLIRLKYNGVWPVVRQRDLSLLQGQKRLQIRARELYFFSNFLKSIYGKIKKKTISP